MQIPPQPVPISEAIQLANMFPRLFLLFTFLLFPSFSWGEDKSLRLAVTTSFENSGLASRLQGPIESDLGIELHFVVVATGQALRLGANGDVDAIFVHAPDEERAFLRAGHATHRREIMFNDFVLIGPRSDKANLRNSPSISDALHRLAKDHALFVSRGDDSGTHKKELDLWRASGFSLQDFSPNWYREVGSGMGATLNIASALQAHTLSDRGTWIHFANKGDLEILFSGGLSLENPYSFLPINPARHPHIKSDLNERLESWLTSKRGQSLIGSYRLQGERLFTPRVGAIEFAP